MVRDCITCTYKVNYGLMLSEAFFRAPNLRLRIGRITTSVAYVAVLSHGITATVSESGGNQGKQP